MKEEWKDKWVAALRSGEYKRGKETLRTANNKFCCLGVLCDIVIKEHPELNLAWDDKSIDRYGVFDQVGILDTTHEYIETEFLPKKIMNIVGMSSNQGIFYYENQPNRHNTLSTLNDSGNSFSYIAKTIEKHWEKL